MRLVTYMHAGEWRLGALVQDSIVDAGRALEAYGIAGGGSISDMTTYLLLDERQRGVVRGAIEQFSGDSEATLPLDWVHLGAPVPQPGKIICAGMNYRDHCEEQQIPLPERLITFVKYTTALCGPGDAITWPREAASQVDYEAELAFVIGRKARNVEEADAMDYVAGYMCLNDVSARDVQFAEKQWVRSKSFDTFCPTGPWLVTPDEIPDPHALDIRCRVNGEVMQESNTGEMVFRIPYIIRLLSSTSTLMPGDIIATGTPGGVGIFRDPKVLLKPGDTVEVEIDGLGVLSNPVA